MALLLTLVRPAFECASTYFAATSFIQPARLVFENALSTQTGLGCQVSALGTFLIVHMTAMVQLWVSTVLGSLAFEAAWWRGRTARQWWLQNGAPTVTA